MRHAIYFAPAPGTMLHAAGSRWLGRDAFTGETLPQPDLAGMAALTAEPRRYGFHATLKPPFALREGVEADALMRAAAALAARERSFRVAHRIGIIDGFLALVPARECGQLDALAGRCVAALDGFRRPPDAEELERRRRMPLTQRQDAHLLRWGYPFVFEDFRFHMTLTGRLPAERAEALRAAAEAHFARALAEPVVIDAITMFQEDSPGGDFLATRQFTFPLSDAEAAA